MIRMGGFVTNPNLQSPLIYVAGHRGMVGAAILRHLVDQGHPQERIVTRSSAELDLTNQASVESFFQDVQPDQVYLAAAKVGGIHANNSLPAEFIYLNLMIEANVIHSAHKTNVNKLLFLGSSCIYPRDTAQPIQEQALLTGPLEATNEWYAIAKIAGIKLCQAYRQQYGRDFISIMPTNLYGPGDNFHPDYSHVPAALLRRFHEAKQDGLSQVSVWGTGTPKREFLHVDDLAAACVFLMDHYSEAEPINVGTGADISIAEFAGYIQQVVGFEGELVFDTSRPDGTPRKVMDVSRLHDLGWQAKIGLAEGLKDYYAWFLEHQNDFRQ